MYTMLQLSIKPDLVNAMRSTQELYVRLHMNICVE